MEGMKVYPLGTVVKAGDEKRYMLTGYIRLAKNGEKADYAALRFPQGNIGTDSFVYFNSEDITEVLFEGYKDPTYSQLEQVLLASDKKADEIAKKLKAQSQEKEKKMNVLE